ncbi:dihydroxyacetone kinase subunit L [Bacillus sp. CCB-MMP212]|uniref:dihydroxyacetone kinase subunit DhaL n=1 Tax=Bacillus sp. CCB-MMP212 TaxID=2928002 RepID=UPI001F62428D|nr:dihydroxyacetone kinase subunit DhaL [Bacillus sp. CCB-MMP212]MCI4252632.1 dihydroxyacetone kinase subunit L [Bacillus sp. CCB-MMP212]
MNITPRHIINWMQLTAKQIEYQKENLTQLDQLIGDGDHGINMDRGFKEVEKKILYTAYDDIGDLFHDIGMVLISKVGGASGPLYGTAFLRAGKVLKGKNKITIDELGHALQESVNGICLRGKTKIGDKTMLDVWEPVLKYIQRHGEKIKPFGLIIFAREQMEKTKPLLAKRGRASFLGERSIGHLDPGAVSSFIIFETLCLSLIGEKDIINEIREQL